MQLNHVIFMLMLSFLCTSMVPLIQAEQTPSIDLLLSEADDSNTFLQEPIIVEPISPFKQWLRSVGSSFLIMILTTKKTVTNWFVNKNIHE